MKAQPEGDIDAAAGLTVTFRVCCLLDNCLFYFFHLISYMYGELHIFCVNPKRVVLNGNRDKVNFFLYTFPK